VYRKIDYSLAHKQAIGNDRRLETRGRDSVKRICPQEQVLRAKTSLSKYIDREVKMGSYNDVYPTVETVYTTAGCTLLLTEGWLVGGYLYVTTVEYRSRR